LVHLVAILLWSLQPWPAPTDAQRACERDIGATAAAYRLGELPQEIRSDLATRLRSLFGAEVADSDAPLLQTDAPTAAERDHATLRFAQAFLVRDRWFVQLEVSLFAGVRTISYQRQPDGLFTLSPLHNFGGPACASIKAALAGVTASHSF
jgi:hypothetical protein